MKIPSLIVNQLYTFGSLDNAGTGIRFDIKNRLSDGTVTTIHRLQIDDDVIETTRVTLETEDGSVLRADELSPERPLPFPLGGSARVHVEGGEVSVGKHRIQLDFVSEPFGRMELSVRDAIAEIEPERTTVPYSKEADYAAAAIEERRKFVERYAKVELQHVDKYSFDPDVTKGNIENFTGVAQVPLGIAGPIKINGEHADSEFLIPLATTEGTLVASYNRGIKVFNLSGGVTCTVVDDYMQRAPVFIFENARDARRFKAWVNENFHRIREAAEATSRIAKLRYIDTILSNRFAFLRFNYRTGDAAGQNMVGRATFAACSWILHEVDYIRRFYLESNLATDKKSSQINMMRTRGKRVISEITIPRDVLEQQMRVTPESIFRHYNVANVGAFLSGANNNGCHSPNAITAMFIATGQDVANVAESSAGMAFVEVDTEGSLYMSLTIPSLIVATYGGGTGLATQRECLEIMDCYGKGKVNKLAEIIGGVALAGELSLAAAISSLEWVSSHEQYGRNR